jgi:hypothetical protein
MYERSRQQRATDLQKPLRADHASVDAHRFIQPAIRIWKYDNGGDHNRRETPLFAASIGLKAVGHQ